MGVQAIQGTAHAEIDQRKLVLDLARAGQLDIEAVSLCFRGGAL